MQHLSQEEDLFMLEDEDDVLEVQSGDPGFVLSPEDQAEIQRLYDRDSSNDEIIPAPSLEKSLVVGDRRHDFAHRPIEHPGDPNQRSPPPGGVPADQIFLILKKGAMKRTSNLVVLNEAKGIAVSVNGGFSGVTDMTIRSRSLFPSPLDAAFGTDFKRTGSKSSCFARFISFNRDLGLTGEDNFDITVDKFVGSTEIEVIIMPLLCYGRIPTDRRTGKRVDLLVETTNGLFFVPISRRNSDRQKCKLVRQRRTINTKPFTLGDKLAVKAQNWALAPTNYQYITMFGDDGPFGGGGGSGNDDDDDDDDDDGDGGGRDHTRADRRRLNESSHDSDLEIDDVLSTPPARSTSRNSSTTSGGRLRNLVNFTPHNRQTLRAMEANPRRSRITNTPRRRTSGSPRQSLDRVIGNRVTKTPGLRSPSVNVKKERTSAESRDGQSATRDASPGPWTRS